MSLAERHSEQLSVAQELWEELDAAHAEILREMASMHAVQASAQPSPDQWAYARWKLSRASRRRRTCVERAYPVALAEATAFERARIVQLREQDPMMLARSRDHVSAWPPERIAEDWAGYCAASRAIRAGMTERVRAEQDVLIPILKRLGTA
jgi:hypothetical protein